MAIKRKADNSEHLDDVNIEKVIKLLEEKGTKKDACRILNISYNVSRLDKIIEGYQERKAFEKKRRGEKRGKPAAEDEISYAIKEYLSGTPIDTISKSLYRGTTFVKSILEDYGIPMRSRTQDYFKPELIPDISVRDRFALKEIVYSARYESLAEIRNELKQNGEYVYGIYLLADKWQEYAYQPAHELASLSKLKEVGINF